MGMLLNRGLEGGGKIRYEARERRRKESHKENYNIVHRSELRFPTISKRRRKREGR